MPDHKAPKFILRNLSIKEGSLVRAGDNPGAHILFFKSKPDDVEDISDDEASALWEESMSQKSWFAKLTQWMSGTTAKGGLTLSQIEAEDKFRDEFWKLRWNFMKSIDSIMATAMDPDTAGMLRATVEEFGDRARMISDEFTGAMKEQIQTAVDDLVEAVNPEKTAKESFGEKFATAMAALEAIEVPEPKTKENSMPADKKKNLDEVLKGLGEDDRAIVQAALEAKKETPTAPPQEDPVDKAMAELPESVRKAIEDRMSAAEKAAKEASEKADRLDKEKKDAEILAKAKGMGIPGVPPEDLAKVLKGEDESGEILEGILGGLAAQVKKSRLFSVVGTEARDDGDSDAKINARAKEIQKAEPGMTFEQAYAKAMKENPELYKELDDEAQAG